MPRNYSPIPEKALDNFKKAIGFLTSDFDINPVGKMDFNPGDKVIIVTGSKIENLATVLKKLYLDDSGDKIYRVTLLNRNSH